MATWRSLFRLFIDLFGAGMPMLIFLVAFVLFCIARNKLPRLNSNTMASMPPASSANDNNQKHTEMSTLSLWLLPPEPYRSELSNVIVEYAQKYHQASSAPFDPHVTILGGIPCRSLEHAQQMAQLLQRGLYQFGSITCEFYKKPRFCKHGMCTTDDCLNEDGKFYVWNQAFVMEMHNNERFLKLCRQAQEILGIPLKTEKHSDGNAEYAFPKPLGRPHMSLFYGEKMVPRSDEVKPIPKFNATQLALWNTSPPTLEGVRYWTQIAVIDLVAA